MSNLAFIVHTYLLIYSVALVRKRTIPTERPPLLTAKLVLTSADRECHVVSVTDLYGHILGFLDRTCCANPIDNTQYAAITTTPSTRTKHSQQNTSVEHLHKTLH
jgi:hypothetical protein